MIVDRYYYAQLNKQEKAVYKAFYNGLMAHEDVIPIPIKGQLSKEIFNKIQPKIIQEKNLQMNYSISILEILIMSKVHLNVLRLKIVLLN